MTLQRRKFLQKTCAGLLSISLVPPAYSLVKRNDPFAVSVNELFSQLSFKKARLSKISLLEKFKLTNASSLELKNTARVLYADKTVCIPRIDSLLPEMKSNATSIHHSTANGFQRILSLNNWELLALQKMKTCLKNDHGVTETKQLRSFLIPVLKTAEHKSQKGIVDGDSSSSYGYYTCNGYCSIRILAKGNRMKVSTSLRNHKKIETHQNSFEISSLS